MYGIIYNVGGIMFEKDKLKENTVLFIALIGIILILTIIDIFINNKDNIFTSLTDDKININQLVINEIMTSNKGAYVDFNGNAYDWIELYNGYDEDINLFNYTLSDEESGKTKWIFPNVTIKSKEYLIVYLSGTNDEGLYANFSLKKEGGELVTLKKPNGKVVDSVKTESLEKNTTMARDSEGNWVKTNEITPGFDNNKEGRNKYLESLKTTEDYLIINEFLPNNKGNYNVNGEFLSYIEVKNTGSETINLYDYFLSNDTLEPFSWRLPNIELKSGEVYLFYTTELDNNNNTDFKLNKSSGTIILSKNNKIVEQVDYTNVTGGYAYIKTNGTFYEGINISPGYDNVEQFNKDCRKNPNDLVINEVMSSNNTYLPQNGGNYYDWIELYNNSDKSINLSDYTITTDVDNVNLYKLEDKELKPGEYYILMASGNINNSNNSYKHANFKISPTESLYLYKDKKLVDSVLISSIPKEYSYGRNNDNGYYYFKTPTPGKANSSGISEIAYTPTFNTKPGIYNDIDKLTVEINGSGTIYYTLDGSEPTTNSKVYDSPLVLSKTTVVRAINYEEGKKISEIVTSSYIINENHTLSVLSIGMNPSDFNRVLNAGGSNLTLPAHAELFENDGSFTIDCGFKLFGGSTRYINKKSFSLKFSSKYGDSSLEYKVFDNREATNYKSLVIRSGSQDSQFSMIRDELATSIMDDYGTVDVQAYKPVILYVNGDYWGIYYLREKVDDDFIQNHYNVDGSYSNIIRIDGEVKYGTSDFYNNLLNFVKYNDISNTNNYNKVKEMLDVENYIDYWIGELYTTNNDIVNQRYFNNTLLDNGKIKMIFYDFDYAFYNQRLNYLSWMIDPNGMGEYHFDNTLLIKLLQNKEFKQLFLERLSYNMNNVWTDSNVLNRFNELKKIIEVEMPRNQERWGYTMDTWYSELDKLEKYIKDRREYMLNSIKWYFGLSSKEMEKYFEDV